MYCRICLCVALALSLSFSALAKDKKDKDENVADELFSGPVPALRIEIPEAGMATLRQYDYVWRQKRPERIDVKATVREGQNVYTNVAIHLKGSFSFQGIDSKPSMTLHFDKFEPGQLFHGLKKIHLNNSVQDSTSLSEQFGREIFKQIGIACPRATPAVVNLNGRNLGLCVLVEGANKQFLKRNFPSAEGNLYDGGAGGDITKELGVISGENADDRSDLKELIAATREPDPVKRLALMQKILDVDEFITFAAIEASIVHWDGYCIGCNNYRVFNDKSRGKLVFMPHGMDQLFGVSSSTTLSLTPVFRGMVAKALFTIPEARARYLKRIEELSAKELSVEALHARIDHLAERLRPSLNQIRAWQLDRGVEDMKARISQRAISIAKQLMNAPRPVQFPKDGVLHVANWRFKSDSSYTARSSRNVVDQHEMLGIAGGGANSSGGTWRTTLFLDEGHYEFTGSAHSQGITNARGIKGVMLRISGDNKTDGFVAGEEWKTLTYAFDVRGLENVELVCEFRGPRGSCEIDAGTLCLKRTGPASKEPIKENEAQDKR